ncbi:MAG: hypothetical protein HWD61_03760 [Parachlamydiaceae bacterium]|nr:MAG: hypothetical protein HWD61_03760 [Parachlamydiaceae bacterium]
MIFNSLIIILFHPSAVRIFEEMQLLEAFGIGFLAATVLAAIFFVLTTFF